MRIYLPLSAQDRQALQDGRRALDLDAGRAAWAVTSEARADRPGEDVEDLEYEAMQDAVFVACSAAQPEQRVLVIAADVHDGAITPETEQAGAFGIVLTAGASAKIASFHVTEQDAATADADDTDPALYWFDAVESREALSFLDEGPTA